MEHASSPDDPVTHITTFLLSDGAPVHDFVRLWTQIAHLMAGQSGFLSARLYRPIVGGTPGQYIHVAHWTSAALLVEAQSNPEIRHLEETTERLVAGRRRVVCHGATNAIVPLA